MVDHHPEGQQHWVLASPRDLDRRMAVLVWVTEMRTQKIPKAFFLGGGGGEEPALRPKDMATGENYPAKELLGMNLELILSSYRLQYWSPFDSSPPWREWDELGGGARGPVLRDTAYFLSSPDGGHFPGKRRQEDYSLYSFLAPIISSACPLSPFL